ncbi:MAG: 1-acyl-sn-glycerol-3-phosphate acyltransferase [Bacteroidetes bacterium]|nr:1-acyl-sn-glycerol-3-phosphate acyltransferase [Bacteroidota bacterium]
MSGKKFIDIEQILKEKLKFWYKLLPSFLIKWLKKKLHEDDFNEMMPKVENKFGLEYNSEGLKLMGVNVEVHGIENIPKTGGVIIAANHPLGGLDGMALIQEIGKVRTDVRFIVNDVLKKLKNFGDIFVGVNKVGRSKSRESLKIIESVYSSNAAVLVFPAGLVSRKQKRGIEDLKWNKSFITKAVKYDKPIVPVFVEGKNSDFFYNFIRWRKCLLIKANIEMLFLPDEMFKQKNNTIKIHVGQPISPNTFDNKQRPQKWANSLKKYVYSGNIQNGKAYNSVE